MVLPRIILPTPSHPLFEISNFAGPRPQHRTPCPQGVKDISPPKAPLSQSPPFSISNLPSAVQRSRPGLRHPKKNRPSPARARGAGGQGRRPPKSPPRALLTTPSHGLNLSLPC